MNDSDSEMSHAGGIDGRTEVAVVDSIATSKCAEKEPTCEFVSLLCAVSALEGADQMLLPSVFYALQYDLRLTLADVALLNLWQSLLLSMAAPAWGYLADQGLMTRRAILVFGCTGWGVVTGLLAIVTSWYPMVALRALNGAFLACLRPTCSGLVADSTIESKRGKINGKIQTSVDLGVMAVSLVATPLSTRLVLGLQGWRTCFLGISAASLALAAVAFWRLPPLRLGEGRSSERSAWSRGEGAVCAVEQEARRLRKILMTPTFLLLIAQGIFGIVPWTALNYMTLYFQTAGLSDLQAGVLTSLSRAAQAAGHFLGGIIGDACARRSRHHGRPLVGQFSALAAVPFICLLFWSIPPGARAFGWYLAILLGLGLTATWQLAGTNWPLLAEIVPAESRSSVVAWDTAIAGSSGAIFGGPLVALLAQSCFGYDSRAGHHAASVESARALGKAFMWVSVVPFLLCFALYSAMHWSYPADLRRIAREQREVEDRHKALDPDKAPDTLGAAAV